MISDFPFAESIIIYIGLSIIFLGLIMLIILSYQSLSRRLNKNEDKKKKSSPGIFTQFTRILFIFLLIAIGFATLFFGAFIQSMTTFNKRVLVAEVRCEKIGSKEDVMRMILIEKRGKYANEPRSFMLIGDQWFVKGEILKWDSWLNFLGLHTMYKLSRVGGYFTNPNEERDKHPTQYTLVPHEDSPKWRWLYKKGYKLPFVDDVYGNSVYKYPDPNKVFKVYVTTNGYSLGTEDEE